MKIYDIWYKIINESRDVQDMVLASLNGQLEVRFKQILVSEINKLHVTFDDGSIACYCDLQLLSDESLQSEGIDKHTALMLYRELILAVDTVRVYTDDDFGNPSDDIDIEVVFRGHTPSEAAQDLLSNICDNILKSEFVDITDSSLSNLKNNRDFFSIRFPSV